jgi:hypothetical protein
MRKMIFMNGDKTPPVKSAPLAKIAGSYWFAYDYHIIADDNCTPKEIVSQKIQEQMGGSTDQYTPIS